jgi:hypothetical protein
MMSILKAKDSTPGHVAQGAPVDADIPKIAQPFKAGSIAARIEQVPTGTKERFYRPYRDSTETPLIYPPLKRWAILIFFPSGYLAAAETFHEIAPPVDYSFVPAWLIFLASFVGLSLIGLMVWWFKRKPQPAQPPKLPREIALEELERISGEIDTMNPYQFSIRVSDILRRYVTNQYALPVTRQTSVEFLTALAKSSPFSADERSLLEDFLNRCDLIKFARYEATSADSRLLLEEATRFVKGEQLALA